MPCTRPPGTGELIRHALEHRVKKIILGLGGSATTDGGAGLAGALGISFLDKDGKELEPGGVHLRELASISTDGLLREAAGCEFLVACDVKNHLCGPLGAAAVFGPQKGADEEQVKILDAALAHYAAVLKDKLHCAAADTDGSGAAGGLFTPRPYDPSEFSVEDSAMGSMRMEGGLSVNFKFTWAMHQPTAKHITICGDRGGLDVEQMVLYQNVGGYQGETKLKYFDNRPFAGVPFDAHHYMYEHVLNVLDGKEEPRVKPEETLNVVSAIEAFYRSAEENREIRTEDLEGYTI